MWKRRTIKMKSEAVIQSEILVEVNKRGHRLWRSNAGKIKDARTQSWIQLFPSGFPDLVGFRKTDGKFICIEVKDYKGQLRDDQKKFKNFIEKQPVIYGVARSWEEAIEIVEGK